MSYDIKNMSFYNDDMVTRIYDNLSKVTDDTIIEFGATAVNGRT